MFYDILDIRKETKNVAILEFLLKGRDAQSGPRNEPYFQQLEHLVRQFQDNNGLKMDGIVGPQTWKMLFYRGYQFSLGAEEYPLSANEYINEYWNNDRFIPKTFNYLHHTAGGPSPEATIHW